MDTVDSATRARIMASVRGKHTKPELLVRSALHRLGYRYRLHDKKLPGHPDIVFPMYKAIILVNGCFWHGHRCQLGTVPSTRRKFWLEKFERNRERDRRNIRLYRDMGWRVLVVWECALKGTRKLRFEEVVTRMVDWLHSDAEYRQIGGRKRRS